MRPSLANQNPPGERWKDHPGSHGHHRGSNFSKVGALFQQLIGSGIEWETNGKITIFNGKITILDDVPHHDIPS